MSRNPDEIHGFIEPDYSQNVHASRSADGPVISAKELSAITEAKPVTRAVYFNPRNGEFEVQQRQSVYRKPTLEERVDKILADIRAEVLRAAKKHPPMNSAHEGHSVLREEVEELWDHVKADTGYSPEAFKEAQQVAAMGVRYILDLEDKA